ncbi:MAG: FAD-binding protein [Bifidobacteriaceae bacterium]|jgi:succinate dehydrogenase/fumarate reductase flavoprotein subunit|nr:FAD-binding protein [Bifidobacteriaceae bacterium]
MRPKDNSERLAVGGLEIELVTAKTIIVGTGAAGYCAADRLAMLGETSVLMVTDRTHGGASRNAGSDKQTYYKLSLAGRQNDSVRAMAETLFNGGAMDGDIALVEAACSVQSFFHLVEAGVAFPRNRLGEYVGYKTDNDPLQRATSAGPRTSRAMVQRLEARVRAAGVPVVEACRVVDLVVEGDRVVGLLCLATSSPVAQFKLFRCANLIYATGGPAGMYADSAYPHGQWGAQGAALRAGARANNLTEWQFGLASLAPRWNVSGSYMQAVPRFTSTDQNGADRREFMAGAIGCAATLSSLTFLKGYQWPFDVRSASRGSSVIDLLVYRERSRLGRRVFLDFRANPIGWNPDALDPEAKHYLRAAGALHLDSPVKRLRALNEPAYRFYRERNPGIDLAGDALEVGVCAQHNNGGLAGDEWWRSNLRGLYPVGEAAGTHGVYRPGGAALNSGQVGAMRAAARIARQSGSPPSAEAFSAAAAPVLRRAAALLEGAGAAHLATGASAVGEALARAARRMSEQAALVRSKTGVRQALAEVKEEVTAFETAPPAANLSSRRDADQLFLLRDVLSSQYVYLAAMADYLDHTNHSRGSVLYTDPAGELPHLVETETISLPAEFRFSLDGGALDSVVQETVWDGRGGPRFEWRQVRPIPDLDEAFETVWRAHRSDENGTTRQSTCAGQT